MPEPLKFIVAPHIVQDLGLNLYTSLPRVLVEFIANAYDADSPWVKISLDKERITKERDVLKKTWELEREKAKGKDVDVPRLAEHALPDDIQIVIEDNGHGMSRDDLQDKFLVAGRRRRDAEPDQKGRSAGGRILMGRKGLGKLAGFGVAQVVSVISRAKGEKHATKIILDYDEIIKVKDTNQIPIKEERLDDGGPFDESGTRVILSRLMYEPMKARLSTIKHQAGDNFAQIDPQDFRIELNGELVEPEHRTLVYAWPKPNRPVEEMVEAEYTAEDDQAVSFQYRIRFTEDRKALSAKDRGVRVYSHKRLAAVPSLLDADTNMHGFRMTDYLDGVVHADFIDDQPEDYVATDRQTLRWDSPLLAPMYEILSNQIKEACKNRQKVRDEEKAREVKQDEFTAKEIEKAALTKKETKVAYRIATAISSLHKKGFEDNGYRNQFSQVIHGLGQGEILAALAGLAEKEMPELDRVVSEVTRLTAEELDGFYRYVKGRLNGIKALKTIVHDTDFKRKQNEKIIQSMFEKSPWLINPMYTQFLTADRALNELFDRLAKHLKIGKYAEEFEEGDKRRPDLVFLLGNTSLARLVIVELKSANLPLDIKHLEQLEYYMEQAEQWLKDQERSDIAVWGELIGSRAVPQSSAQGAILLRRRINEAGPTTSWKVRDYIKVLEETEGAHGELLKTYEEE